MNFGGGLHGDSQYWLAFKKGIQFVVQVSDGCDSPVLIKHMSRLDRLCQI